MHLKKHGKILLNGFIVVAPALFTIYVIGAALLWLDGIVRQGLEAVGLQPYRGLGIVFGIGVIYLVGLLTRSWVFNAVIRIAEAVVERIPLVKTLYSSVKDMLQFVGGGKSGATGKPAVVATGDGSVMMLGLVTPAQTGAFLPGDQERVAVYMPMSYQIGGFTIFVPPDTVQELKGMSVEELMKICLTAGISSTKPKPEATDEAPHVE